MQSSSESMSGTGVVGWWILLRLITELCDLPWADILAVKPCRLRSVSKRDVVNTAMWSRPTIGVRDGSSSDILWHQCLPYFAYLE